MTSGIYPGAELFYRILPSYSRNSPCRPAGHVPRVACRLPLLQEEIAFAGHVVDMHFTPGGAMQLPASDDEPYVSHSWALSRCHTAKILKRRKTKVHICNTTLEQMATIMTKMAAGIPGADVAEQLARMQEHLTAMQPQATLKVGPAANTEIVPSPQKPCHTGAPIGQCV